MRTSKTLNAFGVGQAEQKLAGLRRQLHAKLLLPPDRPLLRLANAVSFEEPTSSFLQDVHEGIGPSGIKGGSQHMIWGSYIYHHYMQVH